MVFLKDLFFKVDYSNLPFVFERITVFLLLGVAIVWALWAVLSKIMYNKNEKLPKEYKIKLTFAWSLIFYYVVFSFYLFFFLKRNGVDSFQWSNPKFYLEVSGHFISIIALIVCFLISQFRLTNSIK